MISHGANTSATILVNRAACRHILNRLLFSRFVPLSFLLSMFGNAGLNRLARNLRALGRRQFRCAGLPPLLADLRQLGGGKCIGSRRPSEFP